MYYVLITYFDDTQDVCTCYSKEEYQDHLEEMKADPESITSVLLLKEADPSELN